MKSRESLMEHTTGETLIPWTEYVGKVIDIANNTIILRVIRHIPIILPVDFFRKSQSIKKGQQIGILMLDDGSIRIRSTQLQQLGPQEVITN
jgi:hypothetical protein